VQVVGPTIGHGGKFRAPLGNTCLMEFGSSPKPIGQSLIETVSKIPELHDVTVEYAEMGLDALVDSGIADDVPVVKTVRALWRGAAGIREALLLRKLVALLQGLGDIDSEDAAKWRRKLQDDEQLEEFGERVIGIVDRVESATKAKLVGLMLREYLNGRCDRETYLRSIEMIDRALTEDLSFLVNHRTEDLSDPACARLMAVGLMMDRSSRYLLESSMPPAPSPEGDLIRKSTREQPPQGRGD